MQEVNLYQPVSKGVRGLLSASSTRTTLLVIGATLLGFWGFADWQVERLRVATQVVRNQLAAQEAMSAAQGPELQGLSDEDLTALIARLETQVAGKSRAVARVTGEAAAPGQGFAARLRAFAERHIDGIWLDHLTLGADASAVGISGSTLSPDSVPRYLRSLAADPALKGGQIDEFIIEKPARGKPAGLLTFKAGHRGLVTHETQEANSDEETT